MATATATERLAQRTAEAEARKAQGAPEEAQPAKVARLPLWPEAVRAVPNSVLRSALFGAIKRGARAYLERVKINAQDRIDQGDLDVWAPVLHVVREQGLGP